MGRGVDHIFGATKIFLKEDGKTMIDKLYNSKLKLMNSYANSLRSYLQTIPSLAGFALKKQRYRATLSLQRYLDCFAIEVKSLKAARVLQRWWMFSKNEYQAKKRRKCCIEIQKYFRRLVYNLNFRASQSRMAVIEQYLACHVVVTRR